MRTKRLITALLAGPLAILLALVAYSSANTILWTRFLDFVAQTRQGSTKLRDLSPWSHDLASAWDNDYIQFENNTTDAPTANLPLGLTINADLFHQQSWPLILLLLAAAMSIAIFAVPLIATRLSASPKSTGLAKEFFQEPTTRSRLISIQSVAIFFLVLSTPLFAAASWYLTYDRIQSSFETSPGITRWARYIHNSFSPQPAEWPFLMLLPMLVAFLYVHFQSKRFIKALPQEARLKHQKHCPNRKCRYQLDPNIHTCPECGLHWKDSITKIKNTHPKISRKKLTLITLAILAIPAITLPLLTKDQRYEIHNWLTLRDDQWLIQYLYLSPFRPIRLQWGSDTVWIVTVENPTIQPKTLLHLGLTLDTVYKINNQPPIVIPYDFRQFTQYITFNNSKVLDVSPYTQYDRLSPFPSNTIYTTFQVIQSPDSILGFPEHQPLSSQAKDFLNQARTLIAP